MELRFYQQEAIAACYDWMSSRETGNPCIVIPTGGGKTPVIATLCNDAVTRWNGRIVVLTHVKELIEQTSGAISRMFPSLWSGVYSAGLKSRETRPPVIVAGIQSVSDKADQLGPRDMIIVDEAHLIPPEGYGRYRSFIDGMRNICPHVRVVGLTATPYRTGTGWLCGQDELLTEICYEISVKELIDRKYLSSLTSKCGKVVDVSNLHVRKGEFVEAEAELLMLSIVNEACARIAAMTADRRSVLIFCAGIKHAETVLSVMRSIQKERVELITGESLDFERKSFVRDFRNGALKYLVNVSVLTTGFDAPNVDAVCLLRPTVSPGLYYQMVGRGFRIAEGKSNCLILDFGNNIERHGPVDQIRPRGVNKGSGTAPLKVCPECASYVPLGVGQCPDCGFVFDVSRHSKHESAPAEVEIISGPPKIEEFEVFDVRYLVHKKKGWEPGMPMTLRVRYKTVSGKAGLDWWGCWQDEWVCPEHDGWSRQKFEQWWRARSNDPIPETADQACAMAQAGALASTLKITVETKFGEKFGRITKYDIGPKPEAIEAGGEDSDFEFPVPEGAGTDDWTQDAPF